MRVSRIGSPIVSPRNPHREAIQKRQESGSEAKPDSVKAALNRPLHTPSTWLGYALRGMGYAPAMQAGERAPLGLRGLGEDFDFSP